MTKKCAWCSADFYCSPSRAAKPGCGRWCSQSCMKRSGFWDEVQAKMQERVGEKNPNFRHGLRRGEHIRVDSGLPWSVATKGGPCRSCGTPSVHLHHAIPRRTAPSAKRDLRNGLPLCARCHKQWHVGRQIPQSVFTEEEWTYLKSVKILGWVTEAWLEKHYPTHATITAPVSPAASS